MTEPVKLTTCESAFGCRNMVPADKQPFEDTNRRLCLTCTIASYQ